MRQTKEGDNLEGNNAKKTLMAFLFASILFGCVVVPSVSAQNCVWITVKDSSGVQYANCDIYEKMDIWSIPDPIGNTGKTGRLEWCDYIPGMPYTFVAELKGRQVGTKTVFPYLAGKQIDIPMTSDLGGINFTSIKLSCISVNKNSSGGINFDYLFKAQKAEGTSPGIDTKNSTNLGITAFMTGLAVPDVEFWVNLNPWEPDRIIEEKLRESEVGRIMLEADFQMKKDFSNYENPCDNETGKAFHKLIDKKREVLVQECMDKFPGEIKDINNVRLDTVDRHVIVPDKVYAYTNETQIYIINATLKINSEPVVNHSSYHVDNQDIGTLSEGCLEELNKSAKELGKYTSELEISMIQPYVVADVNHVKKYEDLRDVYIALALVQWYKSRIDPSMDIFLGRLDSSYSNNSNILKAPIPWSPNKIYDQYVHSFYNGDYKCWENTTSSTQTFQGGGVEFGSISDHLVEIKEMPPEVQDHIERAILNGYIDEGKDVLFGNRQLVNTQQNTTAPGSGSLATGEAIKPDFDLSAEWSNKGVALEEQSKYDEAIKAYDEAIRMNPKNLEAWMNKGFVLDKQGKYDEAIKAYDGAIRMNPKNLEAWMNKGIVLDKQGKYDEAIVAYDEAIRLDPNDTFAWSNKASELQGQGKYDEAITAYDEVIRLNPNDALDWYEKGIALEEQSKYDEAIKAYDEAIRLDPNNYHAWMSKRDVYEDQGKHDEAIKAYDEAIEACDGAIRMNPKNLEAWMNKGIVLDKQGKYDEAIVAYDEAIRLDPNYTFAWSGKGNALKALGRNTDAVAAFAKAKSMG